MVRKVKIAVLVSGSGSNLQAIIDNIESGHLSAQIEIVISNTTEAYALRRAEKHGIPSIVIVSHDFSSREEFDQRLIAILNSHGIDLVVLAGFMRVLSPAVLNAFPLKVMNIHPALLPSFPGIHAQGQASDYAVKFSGCTVHFVDEGVDTGPIIIQAVVPVMPEDTEESLGARILAEEHKIYSQAIQWYAEGRLTVNGRRVSVANAAVARVSLCNPPLESPRN
ncbi:MAG: phosphoribosylglycinamide formyltransferase [Smithellaceae bacterium]|nr:phosphoribosylglycinamide formyltransferase [Smithellaceae bacterium]